MRRARSAASSATDPDAANEMAVYLYCVTDRSVEPDAAVDGVDGHAVEALTAGGATAWLSRVDQAPAASVDTAAAHHAVVEAAFGMAGGGAVVPIRFGQLLSDDAALRSLLVERDGFREERDRVRGCAEFGIRILLHEQAPRQAAPVASGAEAASSATGGGGAAYLRARARALRVREESEARARELARTLEQDLLELVRESLLKVVRDPPGVALAHLVQDDAVGAYAARARASARRLVGARAVVTGPWPAYSFVSKIHGRGIA